MYAYVRVSVREYIRVYLCTSVRIYVCVYECVSVRVRARVIPKPPFSPGDY